MQVKIFSQKTQGWLATELHVVAGPIAHRVAGDAKGDQPSAPIYRQRSLVCAAKVRSFIITTVETNRLEAFSDGVLAIVITIMVLELKVPHDPDIKALRPILPVVLTYLLSFVYIGIYWNNHHHLLKACREITAGIMWANLHLLFWLSLLPFVTGWMGENHFQSIPSALYGAVLLMAALAYYLLQNLIIAVHGRHSKLAKAIGSDLKGKLSPVLYAVAIAISFFQPWIAGCIYIGVALMWLIPDRRVERVLD